MSKLTKSIRDEIVSRATQGLFAAEFTDIYAKQKDFGDRFFDKHIATPEQYVVMKSLPAEFFVSEQLFRVYISEVSCHITLTDSKRTPAFASNYSNINVSDKEMLDEYKKLEDVEKALKKQVEELTDRIHQVVMSATTTEKLLTIWPEGKKFIPDWAFKSTTPMLPAVIVDDLNTALISAGVKLSEVHV